MNRQRVFRWLRITAVRLLVLVLFVLAGTCFCLALLVLFGGVAIWFGLKSAGGFKLAAELAGGGAAALLIGLLVHWLLNRHLGRDSEHSMSIPNGLDSEPDTPG
jgi:hypothetical protein